MNESKYSPVIVVVSGLAPAVIGNLAGWETGLWVLLSLTTASGSALLVMRRISTARATAVVPDSLDESQATTAPPTERPYHEARVEDAALPSAVEGYDLLFSATVWWRPAQDLPTLRSLALSGVATASIVSRAEEIVRTVDPRRASSASYLLDGALGVTQQDGSVSVTAMAADITLTLTAGDRARLQKLDELRKEEMVWEHERQYERNKRVYLGEEVLQSPGSTLVWWLSRHDEEIERAVELIGPLAQLSAAANDTEAPKLFSSGTRTEATVGAEGSRFPEVLHDLGRESDRVDPGDALRLMLQASGVAEGSDEAVTLVHRWVRFLEAVGKPEAAANVRRTVLAEEPCSSSSENHSSEGAGDLISGRRDDSTDAGTSSPINVDAQDGGSHAADTSARTDGYAEKPGSDQSSSFFQKGGPNVSGLDRTS